MRQHDVRHTQHPESWNDLPDVPEGNSQMKEVSKAISKESDTWLVVGIVSLMIFSTINIVLLCQIIELLKCHLK
jgi:Na+/H+-translocating membrane pyrophosphatase